MEDEFDSLISMVSRQAASAQSLEKRFDAYEVNLKEITKKLDEHDSQISDVSKKVNDTILISKVEFKLTNLPTHQQVPQNLL